MSQTMLPSQSFARSVLGDIDRTLTERKYKPSTSSGSTSFVAIDMGEAEAFFERAGAPVPGPRVSSEAATDDAPDGGATGMTHHQSPHGRKLSISEQISHMSHEALQVDVQSRLASIRKRTAAALERAQIAMSSPSSQPARPASPAGKALAQHAESVSGSAIVSAVSPLASVSSVESFPAPPLVAPAVAPHAPGTQHVPHGASARVPVSLSAAQEMEQLARFRTGSSIEALEYITRRLSTGGSTVIPFLAASPTPTSPPANANTASASAKADAFSAHSGVQVQSPSVLKPPASSPARAPSREPGQGMSASSGVLAEVRTQLLHERMAREQAERDQRHLQQQLQRTQERNETEERARSTALQHRAQLADSVQGQLRGQVDSLQRQLLASQAELGSQTAIAQEKQHRINILSTRLAEVQSQLSVLEQQNEVWRDRVSELEVLAAKTTSSLADAEEDSDSKDERIAVLTRQIMHLKQFEPTSAEMLAQQQHLLHVQHALAASEATTARLQHELSQLRQARGEAVQTLGDADTQIERLSSALLSADMRVTQLQQEMAALRADHAQEVRSAQRRIDELTMDVSTYQERLQTAARSCAATESNAATLESSLRSLQEQCAFLTRKLSASEERGEAVEMVNNKLREEGHIKDGVIASLRQEVSLLSSDIERFRLYGQAPASSTAYAQQGMAAPARGTSLSSSSSSSAVHVADEFLGSPLAPTGAPRPFVTPEVQVGQPQHQEAARAVQQYESSHRPELQQHDATGELPEDTEPDFRILPLSAQASMDGLYQQPPAPPHTAHPGAAGAAQQTLALTAPPPSLSSLAYFNAERRRSISWAAAVSPGGGQPSFRAVASGSSDAGLALKATVTTVNAEVQAVVDEADKFLAADTFVDPGSILQPATSQVHASEAAEAVGDSVEDGELIEKAIDLALSGNEEMEADLDSASIEEHFIELEGPTQPLSAYARRRRPAQRTRSPASAVGGASAGTYPTRSRSSSPTQKPAALGPTSQPAQAAVPHYASPKGSYSHPPHTHARTTAPVRVANHKRVLAALTTNLLAGPGCGPSLDAARRALAAHEDKQVVIALITSGARSAGQFAGLYAVSDAGAHANEGQLHLGTVAMPVSGPDQGGGVPSQHVLGTRIFGHGPQILTAALTRVLFKYDTATRAFVPVGIGSGAGAASATGGGHSASGNWGATAGGGLLGLAGSLDQGATLTLTTDAVGIDPAHVIMVRREDGSTSIMAKEAYLK